MSTLSITTLQDRASSDNTAVLNAIHGSAKAWVTISVSGGTPSISDDYNVDSITDNATGDFTINFTSALANANYAVTGTIGDENTNNGFLASSYSTPNTTTTADVAFSNNAGVLVDYSKGSVVIFGDVV